MLLADALFTTMLTLDHVLRDVQTRKLTKSDLDFVVTENLFSLFKLCRQLDC